MRTKYIIVFDLDGTLSIVGDRLKYLKQNDWDSFYEACGEDEINKEIADIFKILQKTDHKIKIVTGRRESVRKKTLDWLIFNHLLINTNDLHMRKDNDKRNDTIIKPKLIESFKDDILMIFEDRTSMVNKWRELGITCLQVADGNF